MTGLVSHQDCRAAWTRNSPRHLQKMCCSCRATSTLSPSPNSFSTPAFQLPFSKSIFHLTLLPRLFNHPAHLGTSRSPSRTSRPTALPPSPQTQAPAFGVAPLSPRIHIFGGGKRRATGWGRAPRARAGPGGCCGGPAVLSGFVGRWLIAPVNHRAAPRSAVYFSDSNLVLALFHTCHRVFFPHIRSL